MTDEGATGLARTWPWVLALVVTLALGLIFGRWAFAPPHVDEAADAPATVKVAETTVGQSMPVAVSASWAARPFGVGAASGVLTSLDVADGDTANLGDRLYSVDLRPVVAAVGEVPAFRDLSQGEHGADVAQVQRFLIELGYLDGSADGDFGPVTKRAVQLWQAKLGVETDGIVRASDVVFATRLPARLRVADDVQVGKRLNPGDVVLSVLDREPEFIATIPSGSMYDPSLPIEVTFGDETVKTVIANSQVDQSNNTMLTLTRQDGTSICADKCYQVSLIPAEAVYPAQQILIPSVTGPGVPAAAVGFTAAGDPYVALTDGTHVPVTIVGQGQGSVVLAGVEDGTTVVLAGTPASPSGGSPAETWTPAP